MRHYHSVSPAHPDYPTGRLLKDVWMFLRPYKWMFTLATLLRLCADLVWLYPAIALASLVTFFAGYETGQPAREAYVILLLWAGASVIRYTAIDLGKYLGFNVATRISTDAQRRAIHHLMTLDARWHERENAGNKLKRIQSGADGLNVLPQLWIINMIEITVNFIGMTFIIATFDLLVAGILLAFLACHFTLSRILIRRTAESTHEVNVAQEKLAGLSFETVNNIRSVRMLGIGGYLSGLIHGQLHGVLSYTDTRNFRNRTRSFSLASLGQAFRLGSLAYIVWGITQGRYDIGFFALFYMYFNRLGEAIGELTEVSQRFVDARYGISRMMDILTTPVGTDDGSWEIPADWKTLSIRNLTFSYGNQPVLHDLSVDIRRGERIGIVGLSGAGKSTLFHLLLKEHAEYTGEILFDGIPLRDISRESYFGHTAVVLQDTEVFNFPLRENITLAKPDLPDEEKRLKEAMEIAHVTDFLDKLPQGVETMIGEKGIRLSGGERQRLGIARAIYKQPELLFMDEATSHLDLESEEKIRNSLHHFFKSVTAVVIAHRLTTIREMDRILVLENGELIEQGTFEELQEKNGRFRELWEKQGF